MAKTATQAPPTEQREVPGAAADAGTLRDWYRDVVQIYAATHALEAFVILCHWCLADAQEVAGRGIRGGELKFCSEHCADAAQAYYVKVLAKGKDATYRPAAPADEGEHATPTEPPVEGLSDAAKELRAAAVAMRGRFSIQSLATSAHKDWYLVRQVLQENPEVFRPINSRAWELVR